MAGYLYEEGIFMKKQFLMIAISMMALIFVAGLAMIPAKTVSADVDTTIKPGQTQGIDLKYDRVWWFKYTPTKDIAVEISSTGSTSVKVELYKDNKEAASLVSQASSSTGPTSGNFALFSKLKAGTYYYKVTTQNTDTYINNNNNTRVTLTEIGSGEKVVKLDKTHFPDDTFRAYVGSTFDLNEDGYLSRDEINCEKSISVGSKAITDLKGIEYLTEITYLDCDSNKLTTLNLTKNTKLRTLYCRYNYDLKSVDLTGCSSLCYLYIYDDSALSSLKLKGCSSLEYLYCYDTSLTSLDLSYATGLYTLDCNKSNIGSLNLSGLKSLRNLNCHDNPLTSLNVKGCTNLYELYCYNTKLPSLDVSSCTALRELYCYSCGDLSSLKINKSLQILDCHRCKLSSLDLSSCSELFDLNCFESGITKLNISSCPWLEHVYNEAYKHTSGSNVYYSGTIDSRSCYLKFDSNTAVTRMSNPDEIVVEINEKNFPDINFRNFISKYDNNGDGKFSKLELASVTSLSIYARNIDRLDGIKYFTSLRYLDCDTNNLTVLDLSKNTNLETLECCSNKLTKLILGSNTNLKSVKCYDNKITTLDLSKVTGLTYLECERNALTSLNLSASTKLERLNCYGNNLKSLDLSKLVALEELVCNSNGMTKLDISKNTKLIRLSCGDNLITSLDLSKNTNLEYLLCDSNKLTNLNISKNTKLICCSCNSNKLTSLDVSKNTKLLYLICSGNDLTKLDISACPNLMRAYKEGSTDNSMGYDYYYYYYYYGMFNNSGLGGISYHLYDQNYDYVLNVDRTVKIIVDVTISLDKKTASVACGKNLTLKATTNSTNTISWKSSDTKIATVDSTGKITGKQAGKVTITATVSGKSAKCTVTVLYKDVINSKDFWYAPTNYLTAKGVVKGYANQTEFRPANVCSRAQMVTFLYRLQGEPKTKATTCNFTDVKSKDYFYKPVIWAVENGITTGVSAKKFNPQGACTRAQTVTFLWRMAGKPEPGKGAKTFSDVKKTDYFYKATLWASGKKILAGYDDGTFRPQGKCLRRQMVTFLYKYDKYVNGKG
jgi:Leucine-rich repeat (LRR) protein